MKRGTIKSFREYLNARCAHMEPHKNGRFEQRTRQYGDYLYHQDREMFDHELAEAIAGNDYQDWTKP